MTGRAILGVIAIIPGGIAVLVFFAALAAYLTAAFLTLAGFCLAGLASWVMFGDQTVEFIKQIWHGQTEKS